MSQSISRRSFLKCAGSGAVSLAAALLTGVPAAAQQPRLAGEPALLDGKAAVELLGYAPAQEMGNVLVYLSVENLSASTLPVGASYLQSREVCTLGDLYSMGTGVTAVCDGKPVRCGSFAAPLYGENAADASVFTLNLTAGRGALLRHPVQSLEYILMPLLMNSNNVAQDLSAAALTKGIGLPGRHTCMTELRLTAWDFLYPALCTLPLLWKVVTLL